jgi:hypothetical protein
LSEVLNEKVTSSNENGFSRRRVVAGVAWSLPVIATAIAAPAAAASGVAASVTLGAPAAISLTGATAASGTGPTGFDVQTGSVNTGSSVSYTIVIESQVQNQKALVQIGSVSAGTGTTTIPQNKKNTTYTGTVPTTPGDHALHVGLSGFKYTDTATKGTFTYVVTLTVTITGSPAIVRTSTLSVTYP